MGQQANGKKTGPHWPQGRLGNVPWANEEKGAYEGKKKDGTRAC